MLDLLVSVVTLVAQSADDDELLSKLVGANIGAAIAVLAFARRLNAAQRGDKRLEPHLLWRYAPSEYAVGWLLPIGFAIALLRRDSPGRDMIVGFVSLVALWALAGVFLILDRRIERGRVSTPGPRAREPHRAAEPTRD